MKILKFGGTSIGTSDRFKALANLVADKEIKLVVLSAMSGTTDTLVEITEFLYQNKKREAKGIINASKKKY